MTSAGAIRAGSLMTPQVAATLALTCLSTLSALTYFTALSQYPTADQLLTLQRLNAFLGDPSAVVPIEGSLLSHILVAPPGAAIRAVLDLFYQANDELAFGLRYTPVLPFALVQVVWSLLLIAALASLLVKLAHGAGAKLNAYLFTFIVLMNAPMLRGLAKVLKYDVLSTLCLVIAIVLYVGVRVKRDAWPFRLGGYSIAGPAFFCGLAFLEKDTSIAVVTLIIGFDLAFIPFASPNTLAALLTALRRLGVFAAVFAATTFLLIPKMLLQPTGYWSLFGGASQYFVNLSALTLPAVVVSLVGAYLFAQFVRRGAQSIEWRVASSAAFAAVSLCAIALFCAAIAFQQNLLFDPTIAGNNINPDALRAQGIYVSQPIAFSAITTLDQNPALQHAKMLFSIGRSIVYTTPEVIVLMIVGAGPLILLLLQRGSLIVADAAVSLMLLLFPVAMLAAYAMADIPFDPKYLMMPSLLLTAWALHAATLGLASAPSQFRSAAQLACCALLSIATLVDGPAYLRYKSIFRDRTAENAAALDMDHYIWWTWAGWGETAYPVQRFVEANRTQPTKIAFDYLAPFSQTPGIDWFRVDYENCLTLDDLRAKLPDVSVQSPDYLLISKNMSNRRWCENQIVRRLRTKAVFVDAQQGVEYSWLFRFSDVRAAFQSSPPATTSP